MQIEQRIRKLEKHLAQESPVLLDVVNIYRDLDRIGHQLGVLDNNESYVSKISWWPLISILGTFSSGKSSFINSYSDEAVQKTGNQAIDDKFTVICYGNSPEVVTLPGLALDADPRFPFYGISEEIDKVESGEGSRIDTYLQLKTVNREILKGKILIDSPGFDADAQRDSVLRISDHIIEMSDLVLVFFDARHPEPGSMRDTLEHLVKNIKERKDAEKFLFILNQIDTAANEDNPEAVIGAWQRALSQAGLVGGRFYAIYNEKVANTIEDPAKADRFKRKKDEDLSDILKRMDKVSVDRSYRITHAIEGIAEAFEVQWLPKIHKEVASWRAKVVWTEMILGGGILAFLIWALSAGGFFNIAFSEWPFAQTLTSSLAAGVISALVVFALIYASHLYVRNRWAKQQVRSILRRFPDGDLARAFAKNAVWWRPMHAKVLRGWGSKTQKAISRILDETKLAIQKLNDQHANPSGDEGHAEDVGANR